MKRAILGLCRSDTDTALESGGDGSTWALEIEDELTYLDDADVIQQGKAAELLEENVRRVQIEGDSVDILSEKDMEVQGTEFIADLPGAGFVGIDSSAGEFLFDMVAVQTGIRVDRAELNLSAFARDRVDEEPEPDWWLIAQRQGDPEDPEGVSIDYHGDALPSDAVRGNVGLGFEYGWNGRLVRGVAYESGYVALFAPQAWSTQHFARWVREEILPYASAPDDDGPGEQTTLS